jgi:glyoxylase-like metal-dependent hydrolase (beta-lactamase superfamily II)
LEEIIMFSRLTRRGLIAATGLLAGSNLLPSLARASAPPLATQNAGWHRFKLGDIEATVVADGPLDMGAPDKTFLGFEKADIDELLTRNFLPLDNVRIEQNALVVNTGGRLVLFDAGMGTMKLLGPNSGRLASNLRAAGIDPAAIDDIVVSHAHFDHIAGIMADDGTRNFPNARIHMARADYDFWVDEAKLGTPLELVAGPALRHLRPNRDRIVFFEDGQEFLPGVQAISAPGHTPGHTVFAISSAGKTMVYIADLSHHHVLLLERPRARFVFDTDPPAAAETRLRIFDRIARERLPILAYHFPWPGLGNLAKSGDGYRYIASPMSLVV